MIVIAAALIGARIGGLTARRRGGNRLDMAQYAAGYALSFVVVGLIATVLIDRSLSVQTALIAYSKAVLGELPTGGANAVAVQQSVLRSAFLTNGH